MGKEKRGNGKETILKEIATGNCPELVIVVNPQIQKNTASPQIQRNPHLDTMEWKRTRKTREDIKSGQRELIDNFPSDGSLRANSLTVQ